MIIQWRNLKRNLIGDIDSSSIYSLKEQLSFYDNFSSFCVWIYVFLLFFLKLYLCILLCVNIDVACSGNTCTNTKLPWISKIGIKLFRFIGICEVFLWVEMFQRDIEKNVFRNSKSKCFNITLSKTLNYKNAKSIRILILNIYFKLI